MQQSMFKYMMIIMVVMFYKVASGLALYFIASSIWGLVERKLIPKPKLKEDATEKKPPGGRGKGVPPKPEPTGPLGRLRERISDTWKRLLEAAEKK
jgi:YidC/Oxa1 family membrane protein insertase